MTREAQASTRSWRWAAARWMRRALAFSLDLFFSRWLGVLFTLYLVY